MTTKHGRRNYTIAGGLGAAMVLSGCASDNFDSELDPADVRESIASTEDSLYLTYPTFPGRFVGVCWNSASVSRPDFALRSEQTRAAVTRSWTQATGIQFGDWGTCPANANGSIRVTLNDGTSANSEGGFDVGSPTEMNLGVGRTDFEVAAIHEFGHAIGYAHEMTRPDFADDATGSCREANIAGGNTLNTPADRQSILASTGYCQGNLILSAWDVVGSQNTYGRPNYFADVTGDGRADAIVVNPNGVYVRLSNGSSFPVALQSKWTDVAYYGNRGTHFADVTGDLRADAIAINDDGIYVRTSNGSSFPASSQSQWATTFIGALGNFFADVNNDNRADAIAVQTNGVFVRLSTGTSFGPASNWTGGAYFGDRGTFFVDVTGDHRADAVVVNAGGVTVRRSNGSSFQANESWTTNPYFGERGILFADINSGGAADAIVVNTAGVFARLSTGSAFSTTVTNWTSGAYFGER